MPQYGDEKYIYAMALMEAEDRNEDIPNDINNGYVVIEDNSIPFNERVIIEKRLYMIIPADFELMPIEIAEIKYPNEGRPDIIFSNEDGSININFKLIEDKLKARDVKTVKDLLQQEMVEKNTECKMVSSAVIEGDTRIGYFDFISPAFDGDIYNLMFLFPLDEQIVLGSFNCMHFDMAGWLEIAVQMLRSIRTVQRKCLYEEAKV